MAEMSTALPVECSDTFPEAVRYPWPHCCEHTAGERRLAHEDDLAERWPPCAAAQVRIAALRELDRRRVQQPPPVEDRLRVDVRSATGRTDLEAQARPGAAGAPAQPPEGRARAHARAPDAGDVPEVGVRVAVAVDVAQADEAAQPL